MQVVIVSVLGGIVSGLGVLVCSAVRPPRRCAACEAPQSRFGNRPANRRQFLWGGYTCPRCGSELDRRGRLVPAVA